MVASTFTTGPTTAFTTSLGDIKLPEEAWSLNAGYRDLLDSLSVCCICCMRDVIDVGNTSDANHVGATRILYASFCGSLCSCLILTSSCRGIEDDLRVFLHIIQRRVDDIAVLVQLLVPDVRGLVVRVVLSSIRIRAVHADSDGVSGNRGTVHVERGGVGVIAGLGKRCLIRNGQRSSLKGVVDVVASGGNINAVLAVNLDDLAVLVGPLDVGFFATIQECLNLRGDLIACVDNVFIDLQIGVLGVRNEAEVHVCPAVTSIAPELRNVHRGSRITEHWCRVGGVCRLSNPLTIALYLDELVEELVVKVLLFKACEVTALVIGLRSNGFCDEIGVVLQQLLLSLNALAARELLKLTEFCYTLISENGSDDAGFALICHVLSSGHREGDSALLSLASLPPHTTGNGATVCRRPGIAGVAGLIHADVWLTVRTLLHHEVRGHFVGEDAGEGEGLRNVRPPARATVGFIHKSGLHTRRLAKRVQIAAGRSLLAWGNPQADANNVRLGVKLVRHAVLIHDLGVVENVGTRATCSAGDIGGLSAIDRRNPAVFIHPLAVYRVAVQALIALADRGEVTGGGGVKTTADHATVGKATLAFS